MWHRHLGWHAEALLRAGRGNRSGALRAARRGMEIVDEHRSTLGATDLRAGASRRVSALASFGMELAIEADRADTVLRWAERTRGAALLYPAAKPPHSEHVSEALSELRQVLRRRREAATEGRPAPALVRQQIHLEETVRRLVRQAEGNGRPTSLRFDRAAIADSLRERVLIEFAKSRGQMLALVLVEGRLRIHRLGNLEPLVEELNQLLFALRRMGAALSQHSRLSRAEGRRSRLLLAAARLDSMLLGPLRDEIGDRALVIVPTEPLHGLPWGVLPSCLGRPISVCPSATLWQLASARGPLALPERAVLVAGPRLVHAEPEVQTLAGLYTDPQVLAGDRAEVAVVLDAMADADVIHLAAHGLFRRDNPLFSAIELADGPLTGYDIERLARGPARAVLSSCETGRAAAWAGGEVLGLAATMLSIGVRAVVAPVLPIPDAETAPLMRELHRGLRAGQTTSEALANAMSGVFDGTDTGLAAGASFICIGI